MSLCVADTHVIRHHKLILRNLCVEIQKCGQSPNHSRRHCKTCSEIKFIIVFIRKSDWCIAEPTICHVNSIINSCFVSNFALRVQYYMCVGRLLLPFWCFYPLYVHSCVQFYTFVYFPLLMHNHYCSCFLGCHFV